MTRAGLGLLDAMWACARGWRRHSGRCTNDQESFRFRLRAGQVSRAGERGWFKPVELEEVVTGSDGRARCDAGGGEHAETVEVTADALAAETTSTQLGETLDAKKMESVPLNGRSFTDLMACSRGSCR